MSDPEINTCNKDIPIGNLEVRCKKALLSIADDVKDINNKLSYFLENYREDYYKAQDKTNSLHQQQWKNF